MPSDYDILGLTERLRQARRLAHLSLADVALRLGQSRGNVHHIERGRADIAVWQLDRLAAIYGVDPLWLLYGLEDDRAAPPRAVLVEAGRVPPPEQAAIRPPRKAGRAHKGGAL